MRKRDTAWAIEIEPENYQAIISEGGREITREFLEEWLVRYPDGGYFVRDGERKMLDCSLMSVEHFWELYRRVEDRVVCNPETMPTDATDCNGAHFFPIESDMTPDFMKLLAS